MADVLALEQLVREKLGDECPRPQVKIERFDSGGANYTSALFKILVSRSGRDDLQLFAKVASFSEAMRTKESHDVPLEHRFVFPEYFGHSSTHGNEAIVIDDLGVQGYKSFNRFASMNWEYASKSVETLAKFHALSLVFAHEQPEEFEKIAAGMQYGIGVNADEASKELYVKIVESSLATLPEDYRDRVRKVVYSEEVMKFHNKPVKKVVLAHGDFRPSNLLFKRKEGVLHARAVDYQMMHAGCALADLIYFITVGSDKQFRDKYFHRLIEYYREQLELALSRFSLDIEDVYPKKIFDEELAVILQLAVVISVMILPSVMADAEDAPKAGSNFDFFESTVKPGQLFTERFKELIQDCIDWGVPQLTRHNTTKWRVHTSPTRCVVSLRRPPHLTQLTRTGIASDATQHKPSQHTASEKSSEYRRMPPLFSLDEYEQCLSDTGGTYCLLDLDLFSDQPSELMRYIHEYSSDTKKHFNHTQIHRGVCVTQRCSYANYTTRDLNTTLEACLNNTIWQHYNIQARLNKINYCNSAEDRGGFQIFSIYQNELILTLACHLRLEQYIYSTVSGNPYILSFSLRRNWAKLVSPSGIGSDPRLERLKSFHGLRAITMACVIFSHVALAMGYCYLENPDFVEKSFEDPSKQILFHGNLVTHTFFVMSAFLLAYNFQINAEKHKASLWDFPKGVLLRLIRLTPTYALVLATSATLLRHMGGGPMWQHVVGRHASDCRRYWWTHMLYIQNYMSTDNTCLLETWYLAADTQLFCVGLLVCLLCRRSRAKRLALVSLFLLSLLITAATTYFRDLDPIFYQSPEMIRSLYTRDWTFRYSYIPGHTNLSPYVLGLAGGFLAYHWQTDSKDVDKYKKYRYVVWSLFPLGVLLILSGAVFYMDVAIPNSFKLVYATLYKPLFQLMKYRYVVWSLFPLGVLLILSGAVFYMDVAIPNSFKLVYATLYKPLFQLMVVILIMSCVFKIESVYRCILEWRGFTWAGRLTYGVYLLHTSFQRTLIGSQVQTIYIREYNVIAVMFATMFMSTLASGALWLCVESPVAALSKAFFPKKKRVET
ncbi:Nose resistant to fluoxetine protein 6 [Papilio machaon]|uniref:Nose resistant to fluoxetine protein 6 n=1 Tax=Papilio machaon TaxID=76193 RepID=A0A0N0PAP1_PAPMA|nr:Nose resistant to fluoxetine protein 6 [Papilio machaon]